ncbi:terminase small subunit [Cytophagaceae bacterium YF14B1]|uniref:Terminase small subunit n=1 Tax=Xanthocytophaga flava TaxID=3048013 RepID=A0AAE3UAB4_9BACT|nr:terminase small subunit [Xanthocytophaga flavus]MDJ1483108.1 terminase small subunit [Xanthocytophaga flavus]
MPDTMDSSLNPKQLAFVNQYLLSGNATESYQTVYGVESRDVANANAARLLAKTSIQDYIRNIQITIMQNTTITLEEVVTRINDLSQNAKADADKLKALDMLMKYLGGYVTAQDLAANLSEEQRERLLEELIKRVDK